MGLGGDKCRAQDIGQQVCLWEMGGRNAFGCVCYELCQLSDMELPGSAITEEM